jgi:site-specific DNA-cytosine methylase
MGILENVLALISSGQALGALDMLRQVGYYCKFVASNACMYGIPQFRGRVYFLCIRADWCDPSWGEDSHFVPLVDHLFARLRRGHVVPTSLDSFLLPECHGRVVEHLAYKSVRGQTLEGEVNMRSQVETRVRLSKCVVLWLLGIEMSGFGDFPQGPQRVS